MYKQGRQTSRTVHFERHSYGDLVYQLQLDNKWPNLIQPHKNAQDLKHAGVRLQARITVQHLLRTRSITLLLADGKRRRSAKASMVLTAASSSQ